MIGNQSGTEGEELAPLLSTTNLVPAKTNVGLEDGLYDTPQELSPGVTYTGDVAEHMLLGEGRLTCERGVYAGTFHENVLTGPGSFMTREATNSTEDSEEIVSPSEARRRTQRHASASTTSASLLGLTEERLDPTTIASYKGEWAEGVPHGRGVMRWANGDKYEGLFDRGQPNGGGGSDTASTFTFADGRVYTGEFAHGLRDGKGKIVHVNGDIYDGQFVRGTVTGFGTIIYAKGPRLYRGLFERGRKVKGYLRFPGSQRGYDGEWQDDVPHGSGCMTFANGDFYKGDFAGGELHGVGCLCYQNPAGKIYYGQFVRGQPFGRGFLYEPEETQSDDSQTETAQATVTDGYFQNGLAVPDSDKEACDAVIEATRGLRMPEATPPSYATLLQLRPATTATAASGLTSSFAGFSFSTMGHSEMGSTPPTFAAAGPALPLFPTKKTSSIAAPKSFATTTPTMHTVPSLMMGATGISTSPPTASLGNGSFARARHSGTNAPLSEGTGADDEEAIVSATSNDLEVDEAEADNAILVGTSDDNEDSSSRMPSLSNAAAHDGSCRGWLEKCAIGRHNLSLMSNWKRRYFILALCNDCVCLGYYEDEECRKPIGFIRLNPTDTRIVTCPTTKTHKKASRPGRDLCVIYHEKRKEYKLLLRAKDTEDHDRWATAFRTFFLIVDRASDYPMHAFQS